MEVDDKEEEMNLVTVTYRDVTLEAGCDRTYLRLKWSVYFV